MLAYVHLADSQRLEPGKGHLDFANVFARPRPHRLRRAGRPWSATCRATPTSCCRRRCAFLRSHLERAAWRRLMTTVRAVPEALREPVERGEIGGRTVQLTETGEVETVRYEPAPLADGQVRVRTVRSAISSGTEMTFYGRRATNVYLHKRWNEELRLFEPGTASMEYPLVIGYRAAGEVVESRVRAWPSVRGCTAAGGTPSSRRFPRTRRWLSALPDELSWDDGVDIAQMGPICVNAAAYGEGEHAGGPAVVFGAGVGRPAHRADRAGHRRGAGPRRRSPAASAWRSRRRSASRRSMRADGRRRRSDAQASPRRRGHPRGLGVHRRDARAA